MEAASSSETPITINGSTEWSKPEEQILNIRRCEKLKHITYKRVTSYRSLIRRWLLYLKFIMICVSRASEYNFKISEYKNKRLGTTVK
jgi:hypothetical protein